MLRHPQACDFRVRPTPDNLFVSKFPPPEALALDPSPFRTLHSLSPEPKHFKTPDPEALQNVSNPEPLKNAQPDPEALQKVNNPEPLKNAKPSRNPKP